MQVALTVIVIVLFAWISSVYPQSRKAFTINEISELIKSGVNPDRVARFVEQYGVAFEWDDRTLQRLKQDGASEAVLSAVKRMSAQYTEERQLKIKEQEEATKRQRQEEAKRKEQERIRADEEKRRQAELARKKQEEAQQRAQEIKQRQQEEARRKEEELRRAEEQKRQQAEAEKARQAEAQRQQEEARRKEEDLRKAEEQKRQQAEAEKVRQAEAQRQQEETRLAEEKRRVEEEARRASAERKKQEEIQARNRDAMIAKGTIEEPSYRNGECWTFKVVTKTSIYTTRDIGDGDYRICIANRSFVNIQDGKRSAISNFWAFAFPLKERDTLKVLDKFPLTIGQKWSHQYEGVVRGTNKKNKYTADSHVSGWETVTTPAGTFNSLKIERGEWVGGRQVAKLVYYWSPQTKSAVSYKREFLAENFTRDIILTCTC